jgi:NAD dependent epimerase/dehydratase
MQNHYKNKKILITGATGFIGSHLTEALLRLGAQVTALAQYNSRSSLGGLENVAHHELLTIIHGDVRDPFLMARLTQDCHTIFHLAALIGIPYSYQAPQSYIETNLKGTLNLLEGARLHGVEQVIITSTSEVYGTAVITPMTENHPLQAQSPYSASKIAADTLASSYAAAFKLPVTLVRPFNTYGPRQSARAIIPTIITQALKDKALKLGNLVPVRDFNFVEDIVDGFLRAAMYREKVGETFNLATGVPTSIAGLIAAVAEIMDMDLPTEVEMKRTRPSTSEVFKLIGDASKAKELLGWQPSHSLKAGLAKTIAWFKENPQLWQNTDKYVI